MSTATRKELKANNMEAVWNLEDKWKLSTKQALLLLLFTASGVLGLCVVTTATLLRRLKSRRSTPPPQKQHLIIEDAEDWPLPMDPACGWAAIKKVLMSSLRWSRASKWRPGDIMMMSRSVGSSWRETPLPLLMQKEMTPPPETFHDHDLESPVWQRPILMGEKCELPRFSGLILYDENGKLCDVARKETSCKITTTQEKSTATVVRKTLRDLL